MTLASGGHGSLRHHRDFRLLWLGETVSTAGANITRVALPFVAVVTLHASTFEVSLLTAAAWLPWLIIGLPAGAWVDRLPRRPVMLVCDGASLMLLLSVPLTAWAGALTIGHLLAVALAVGVASVFFQTAYEVYLPALVEAEQLPEANAKLMGSESVGDVASPGLAGLIAQLAGAVTGLLVDAVSFGVSAACLLAIRTHEQPPTRSRRVTGMWVEVREGLRFVAGDPYLRVFTVFGAAANLALMGYQAILVVFLVRELGLSPGVTGLVLSGMSVGGVFGAILAGRVARRFGTARGVLIAQLGAAPCALLIPLADAGPRLVLVVLGGVGIGTGVVASNVIAGSWRQTYCPRAMLGRTLVSMKFLNHGGAPLGALLGGLLGSAFGLRPTIWIMAGALTAASLVLLIGPLRHHRDLPTTALIR